MAQDTDRQTRTGLLTAGGKMEAVDATLAAISTDHEESYGRILERARYLVKGALLATYQLIEAGIELQGGREPAQMSIDGFESELRRSTGGTPSDDAADAVRVALEAADGEIDLYDDDTPDAGFEEDAGGEDDAPGEQGRDAFRDPQILSDSIAERGRTIHPADISLWSDDERDQVRRYLGALEHMDRTGAEGPTPEPPAVWRRAYLEDLTLSDDNDLELLLSWVGVPMPRKSELGDSARAKLIAWAEAAHKTDAGRDGVEMPLTPPLILPMRAGIEAIVADVKDREPVSRVDLIAEHQAKEFGAAYAVAALVAMQVLELADDDQVAMGADELDSTEVGKVAAKIAGRKLHYPFSPAALRARAQPGNDPGGETASGVDHGGPDEDADPPQDLAPPDETEPLEVEA